MGIISLMRVAKDHSLNLLEQAKFTAELLTMHQMSVAEIAQKLCRSKGWVSMRCNLLDQMSEPVQRLLFRGAFPVYSYMYTLRPFMRMNSAGKESVERFVKAVAGQRLSVRDIELLAQGYFRGPPALREAVDQGKWSWSLEQLKGVPEDPQGCNDFERALLKDLQTLHRSMQRVMLKCQDQRLQNRTFFAEANLLAGGVLSNWEPFCQRMKEFYDRTGQA